MKKISLNKTVRADFLFPEDFAHKCFYVPESNETTRGSFRDVEIADDYKISQNNKMIKFFVSEQREVKYVIPKGIVVMRDNETGEPLCVIKDNNVYFSFNPNESIRMILEEKYFSPKKNIFMRLPFHHHKVPGTFRHAISKFMYLTSKMKNKSYEFPAWPFEQSLEAFRYAVRNTLKKQMHDESVVEWPCRKKYAVIFTHDIDTNMGIRGAEEIAIYEKSMGIISCWNIPCTVILKNRFFVDALIKEGHEVAIHGYNHDNRFAHLPEKEMRERYLKCVDVANQIGARGFRSPSLLISDSLYEILQDGFTWSSSTIDTDNNTIVGPARGCATVFPFYRGRILEMPLTVPFEDKLLLMGNTPSELQNRQLEKISSVSKLGGMVMYANHTEPHLSGRKDLLSVYKNIVEHCFSHSEAWITLPSELEKFWRSKFPVD